MGHIYTNTNNSNIKLLSLYYSTERFLKNNLASPLISAVRPVIAVEEHSYGLIVEKAMPNLVSKVNAEKFLKLLRKNSLKLTLVKLQRLNLWGMNFRLIKL